MRNHLLLDRELLKRLSPREGSGNSEIWISSFDVPQEVSASEETDGGLSIRFTYRDEEKPGWEQVVDEKPG